MIRVRFYGLVVVLLGLVRLFLVSIRKFRCRWVIVCFFFGWGIIWGK